MLSITDYFSKAENYGKKVRTFLCNVNVFSWSISVPTLPTLEVSVPLFPSRVSHSPEAVYVY